MPASLRIVPAQRFSRRSNSRWPSVSRKSSGQPTTVRAASSESVSGNATDMAWIAGLRVPNALPKPDRRAAAISFNHCGSSRSGNRSPSSLAECSTRKTSGRGSCASRIVPTDPASSRCIREPTGEEIEFGRRDSARSAVTACNPSRIEIFADKPVSCESSRNGPCNNPSTCSRRAYDRVTCASPKASRNSPRRLSRSQLFFTRVRKIRYVVAGAIPSSIDSCFAPRPPPSFAAIA